MKDTKAELAGREIGGICSVLFNAMEV